VITIEYCAEGEAVSDFAVEEWWEKVRTQAAMGLSARSRVSTGLAIDRVRVGIVDGELPHQDVEFLFRGECLRLDADGFTDRWPNGFCDSYEKLARRLLEGHVRRAHS